MATAAELSLSSLDDNEERFILSRRRVVIFIFFVGLVVLALIFLIRIDVDIKQGQIGEKAHIIEKVTPVLPEPVDTAINGVISKINKGQAVTAAVQENQRDPTMLLSALFGSLYNRPIHE